MIIKAKKLLKCIVWFIQNIRLISQMLNSDDGEKNFGWFVQNVEIIDRVVKSLTGKAK